MTNQRSELFQGSQSAPFFFFLISLSDRSASQFSKDFELLGGFKVQHDHGKSCVVFGGKKFGGKIYISLAPCFCYTALQPGVTRVPRECCVRFIWRPASFYFTNYVNSSQIILRANLSDNDFFQNKTVLIVQYPGYRFMMWIHVHIFCRQNCELND